MKCRSIMMMVCGVLALGIIITPTLTLAAFVKGIYVTQSTAQHTKKMRYLIRRAKKVGINTFIVDYYYRNTRYRKNITMLRGHGIRYVARIVVFPYGAKAHQVTSQKILTKRLRRIKQAIALGASGIQLDYIRYHRGHYSSKQNAHNIHKVIKYFKRHIPKHIELQIDIFGVAALGPSKAIGQNVELFANTVDTINPMVYPSHYEPFRWHAQRPYLTVLDSVSSLRRQLHRHRHVKVYAFIELYNYRYPMSRSTKVKYIKAQIRGARDGGANGCYVWSAKNKYSILFDILEKSR